MSSLFSRSIRNKLVAVFLATSLVPILIVGAISYIMAQNAIKAEVLSAVTAVAQGREESVIRYLRTKEKVTKGFASDMFIRVTLEKIEQKGQDAGQLSAELSRYLHEDKEPVDTDINTTYVLNMQGIIVGSSDKAMLGEDKSKDDYFVSGQNVLHIKDAYISSAGFPTIAVSSPIKDASSDKIIGVMINRYKMDELNKILSQKAGLGETGESYLVNKDGLMITDSRFFKDTFLKQRVDTASVRLFQSQKKIMAGVYRDYRGEWTLGASNGDDLDKETGLGWVIVAEIDVREAFIATSRLLVAIFFVTLLITGIVVAIASKASKNIADPIRDLAKAASNIAKGDLTAQVKVKRDDEIGILADSFRTMSGNLNSIISNMFNAVTQITSASSEILAASQEQAAGAREQSAAVSETTSAARELSKSAEQVGDSIKRVSEVATHALAGMAKIKEAMAKTGGIITSLSEKSQKIGKITDVIDDVADQTNLLAVNAAIEAARAGEQGRGFTVVADEIRKLADSTAKSTKDITALIEIIQHEMSNAIMSMETSVNSVDEESKLSQESAERSKEIAMSTAQQVAGSKQIADAMVNIDEAMKQITVGAQQSQVAVKQLTELGKELGNMAGKFKIQT